MVYSSPGFDNQHRHPRRDCSHPLKSSARLCLANPLTLLTTTILTPITLLQLSLFWNRA